MGSGIRPVGVAERRARLAARHHLAPRAATVPDAVADIIGLHGTDPASVYLSAWARTGATHADIEHALYAERTLIRMLGMRRTVFVVPVGLVPVIQAACTDQIAEKMRRDLGRRVEESGIAADGANWLKEVGEATVQALAARGSATGGELAQDEPRLRAQIVYASDKSYGGPVNVTTRLLTLLSAEGLIVRGRPRGGWTSSQFTWAAAPDQPRPAAATARAELARRWLHGFGPASRADLQWWTGWTAGQVKQALDQLEIAEVDLGGTPGVMLAADEETRAGRRAMGSAAARARPHRDGLARPGLVRRRARPRAVRPVRQHRPDDLVGRPDRRRLGAPQGRRDRGPAARGRRDGGLGGHRRRGPAPERVDRRGPEEREDPDHAALPHPA